MFIAYYDESGDDGYPNYSSKFFVLSAIYLRIAAWQSIYTEITKFRQTLKQNHNFPIKTEFHTRDFLLNKGIYSSFNYSDQERLYIVTKFCDLIGSLKVRIINVAIVKPRIKFIGYKVLDKAVTFSIQRIDNDMNQQTTNEKKIILITDRGRVGKMRKTLRRMQRINYIPSQFSTTPYRRQIDCVVEDIIEKESNQSYFIQFVDLVSYIVNLYTIGITGIGAYPARLPSAITHATIIDWLNRILPSINTKACPSQPYGIFYHPT
jgi:hypothetical protein